MSEYDELTPEELELLKSISKVESSEGANTRHKVNSDSQEIVLGAVLLLAVLLDHMKRTKMSSV